MEPGQTIEERPVATRIRRHWRRFLPAIGGIVAVAFGCIVWALASFGSLHHAWLYAAGIRVTIEPTVVDVPVGEVGDTREAVYVLRNLADRPVTVLGVTTSCTCVSTEHLPILVPPGGSHQLRVTLKLDDSPTGRTEQIAVYHTDHPAVPSLTAKVTGRLIAPEK